jgi:hypothetical protein
MTAGSEPSAGGRLTPNQGLDGLLDCANAMTGMDNNPAISNVVRITAPYRIGIDERHR